MMNLKIPTFLKEALFNDYKFSIIPSGRRTGKTFNAAQWLIIELLKNPGSAGLWVDTTQSNIDAYVDRYFKKLLSPIWNECNYNGQRKILKLPEVNVEGKEEPLQSYIDFGSAERPENLEGFQYNYAVLNEAGIILKKESLWYNTLLPMFKGDSTRVKVIGTPKSKNTFHKLYEMGRQDNDQYKSFHFSAYDSPFWTKEELDKVQKQVPQEAFRQEYLAEFIDGAGAVFRNIQQCIREPNPNLTVDVMAVDLAKHQDFTVIMLGNKEAKQVISIDRFNEIEWGFQKNRIYNTWISNGKPQVLIDSTGVGDPIYDDLKKAGMNIEGYKFTNQSKKELIEGLSVAMDNQAINFPNHEQLISELEVFGYEYTPNGTVRYNAPEGFHDDLVIALALLNYQIKAYQTLNLYWMDDFTEDND